MVGAFIKYFRMKKNMTQEDIAEKLNITRQAISSWEMGKTEPDLEMLQKLADVLDVAVEVLLGGEEIFSSQILEITCESMPALRLIGKRYAGNIDVRSLWQEWYRTEWFAELKAFTRQADTHFLGAKRIVGGMLEYWIGVLCPLETCVPDGYDGIEIDALKYAVFKLYGKPLQLTSFETHQLCLDELRERGLVRFEDHWCLERHGRDDFGMLAVTTPVVTEYCISITNN